MMEIGKMINKKDMELRHGQMDLSLKAIMKMVKNKEKVYFFYLGKYQWSDGSVYSGDREDNKIVGYGIYTWIDGRKYEGNWENNFMHGKGKYSWQDGRNYEGNYHQDKKEGYGIYTWVKKIYLG